MARQPNIIPSAQLHLCLPINIMTQLQLHLFSELEGRIPKGGYAEFFTARIVEFFEQKELDLAPYAGSLQIAPGTIVRGSPHTISLLKDILEKRK